MGPHAASCFDSNDHDLITVTLLLCPAFCQNIWDISFVRSLEVIPLTSKKPTLQSLGSSRRRPTSFVRFLWPIRIPPRRISANHNARALAVPLLIMSWNEPSHLCSKRLVLQRLRSVVFNLRGDQNHQTKQLPAVVKLTTAPARH